MEKCMRITSHKEYWNSSTSSHQPNESGTFSLRECICLLNDGFKQIRTKQRMTEKQIHFFQYIWNISCLYNLQVFCSFSLVLSFSLNFYSVRQQSPIILFGLCFQCCLSWLLSRFRWYKYETEKENGEKKCIMCTKQCVNNAPTFMTMQHWHRHYETGNSIQKFNIPHSYTAIDKVSQRAGYIEVNTLKRERDWTDPASNTL